MRGRVPVAKTVASAITLTTGGSGGRNGPTAQIGAGFRPLHVHVVPNHLKPAIGGLCTGIIGFFPPQPPAFGYGYAQMALFNQLFISTC